MSKLDIFHPNQLGGIQQRSTEDAGLILTHIIKSGWCKGLKTSVLAFDIAQFFPSINHKLLVRVLECWITGAFRTSPGGGVEAIAGLTPVFLHLRKLATKAVCRIKTLSDTHPIRSLLKGPERKKAEPHALSLSKLGNPERMNCMQSAITEVQQIIGGLRGFQTMCR